MSNSNTNLYTIQLPLHQNYHILHSFKSGNKVVQVVMTYINDEEEAELDNLKEGTYHITRENRTFKVKAHDVYCYGDIDLNKEDDVNYVKQFKFLDGLFGIGIKIPSHYDYKAHICYSPTKREQWTETWSTLDLVKFAHASLNKPKKILLFKTNK